jgi:DNA N-6-adenine-methyltransferase (Dam)
VWLNPPYGQPEIGQFIDKIISESSLGRVESAIVLTHNYTDTFWFQSAARWADAICFMRGRIRFESPTGEIAAPTQGQAFFYSGPDFQLFKHIFEDTGFVI